MKSGQRGRSTSDVEVTNVTARGFWVLLKTRELFVPYRQFPWFQDATIREITSVVRRSEGHLYWPSLDVDLAVESIERPEHFPLVSRAPVSGELRRSRNPRRPAPASRSPRRAARR
jgi:hypothetical protein